MAYRVTHVAMLAVGKIKGTKRWSRKKRVPGVINTTGCAEGDAITPVVIELKTARKRS